MKPLAILLVILVIAALAGVGYLYTSANFTVAFSSVVATDPLNQADYFAGLKSSLESKTFAGTEYSSAPLASPENYLFYTWTLHAENHSFLPVDTVEIQVTPMTGDVLCIGDPADHSLSPGGAADLSVTFLTARSMHSVREAVVTWYAWGLPFSTRLTLGK
ncbi:MAG: hypothetical protein IKO25_04005 [Clostridia bacterium]|nr:hypothetical protein [Clostridia bacterium]